MSLIPTEKRVSKFLSLVLRHRPKLINLELDPNGWAPVADVLTGLRLEDFNVDRALLERVVAGDEKQRYAISDDGSQIRANQGHSVRVDLALDAIVPPDALYHGTVDAALDSIRRQGLLKRKRHHVHLSVDVETATIVGDRRGEAIILTIDAQRMHAEGALFYRSANGVWLTESVASEFLARDGAAL